MAVLKIQIDRKKNGRGIDPMEIKRQVLEVLKDGKLVGKRAAKKISGIRDRDIVGISIRERRKSNGIVVEQPELVCGRALVADCSNSKRVQRAIVEAVNAGFRHAQSPSSFSFKVPSTSTEGSSAAASHSSGKEVRANLGTRPMSGTAK